MQRQPHTNSWPTFIHFIVSPELRIPKAEDKITLRQFLLNQRVRFIGDHASTAFISSSEEAFNIVMKGEKIVQIDPRDEDKRKVLFDLTRIGEVEQATAATYLWSDTYHLLSSRWSLPCVRCEYLQPS